jgi:transposase InsO family protein
VGEADVGFKTKLCAFFSLDRSSQYKRHIRAAADEELAAQIREARKTHKYYGHRRLAVELDVNKKRVQRVMKAYDIPPPPRRKKYTKANTGASTKPAPPNLLKDRKLKLPDGTVEQYIGLTARYPHHIWAEDFTYLWFQGKFYYLATVIDLYTRQITGWSLSAKHDTRLITAALMDAVSRHSAPAVLHNDRGSEYLSRQYMTICASLEITCSASAAGKPWQNGFQESFYNNFKLELDDISQLENQGQLLEAIALQLHYYNTKRIHSSLATNPAAYAARYVATGVREVEQRESTTLTGVGDKVMLGLGA